MFINNVKLFLEREYSCLALKLNNQVTKLSQGAFKSI